MFYVYASFLYARQKKKRKQNVTALWQLFLILCFQGLAYLVIFEQTKEMSMWVFYGAQVLFLVLYQIVFCLFYKESSRLLLNHLCMLLVIGLVIQTRLNPSKAWNRLTYEPKVALRTTSGGIQATNRTYNPQFALTTFSVRTVCYMSELQNNNTYDYILQNHTFA